MNFNRWPRVCGQSSLNNLSAKAIVAMEAYAAMAKKIGDLKRYAQFDELCKGYVTKWQSMADDGEHYALTFDKKGTWSQKYNLVWDKVLKLNYFPPAVFEKELNVETHLKSA